MAATKRLEYIDAMRGFTMLLVVFSHVILMGYSEPEMPSYNFAFVQFRMPLFFFISGFVLYKAERVWDYATSMAFIRKKFLVQIVPTLVFFTVSVWLFDWSFVNGICGAVKYGYWFTIALFEYFILHVFASYLSYKLQIKPFIHVFVVLLVTIASLAHLENVLPPWLVGLLGIEQLRYFPFFYLGILLKKHFELFCHITNHSILIALVIFLFFLNVLFKEDIVPETFLSYSVLSKQVICKLFFYVTGTLGIIVVFTFFRKKEALFTQGTFVGRSLQYIGRRTLDVYLLHYFFLPYNLRSLGSFFRDNSNPSLEFFCTLSIAVLVVALSLCMSNILRLSPLFEQYLFGVKAKK